MRTWPEFNPLTLAVSIPAGGVITGGAWNAGGDVLEPYHNHRNHWAAARTRRAKRNRGCYPLTETKVVKTEGGLGSATQGMGDGHSEIGQRSRVSQRNHPVNKLPGAAQIAHVVRQRHYFLPHSLRSGAQSSRKRPADQVCCTLVSTSLRFEGAKVAALVEVRLLPFPLRQSAGVKESGMDTQNALSEPVGITVYVWRTPALPGVTAGRVPAGRDDDQITL